MTRHRGRRGVFIFIFNATHVSLPRASLLLLLLLLLDFCRVVISIGLSCAPYF